MKHIALFLILLLAVVFAGCAGMPKLFEPAEPYCTAEEQKDSIIYKHLNPGDTDFALVLFSAGVLEKNPHLAPMIKDRLLELRAAVESGITAAALEKMVRDKFSLVMGVALGRVLEKFKGVNVPLGVCDRRLVLGHIDNQLEIVEMILGKFKTAVVIVTFDPMAVTTMK